MGFNDILKSLFGNKADRDMKEIKPIVAKVNAEWEKVKKLSHDELHQYVVENKILDENSVYITLEDCMQNNFNIEKIMKEFGLDKYV